MDVTSTDLAVQQSWFAVQPRTLQSLAIHSLCRNMCGAFKVEAVLPMLPSSLRPHFIREALEFVFESRQPHLMLYLLFKHIHTYGGLDYITDHFVVDASFCYNYASLCTEYWYEFVRAKCLLYAYQNDSGDDSGDDSEEDDDDDDDDDDPGKQRNGCRPPDSHGHRPRPSAGFRPGLSGRNDAVEPRTIARMTKRPDRPIVSDVDNLPTSVPDDDDDDDDDDTAVLQDNVGRCTYRGYGGLRHTSYASKRHAHLATVRFLRNHFVQLMAYVGPLWASTNSLVRYALQTFPAEFLHTQLDHVSAVRVDYFVHVSFRRQYCESCHMNALSAYEHLDIPVRRRNHITVNYLLPHRDTPSFIESLMRLLNLPPDYDPLCCQHCGRLLFHLVPMRAKMLPEQVDVLKQVDVGLLVFQDDYMFATDDVDL